MSTRTASRPRHARFDPSLQPLNTNAVATCSVVTNKWQIDLTNPVQIVNLPADFTVNGAAPTSYVQNSPTRITLTYAVNVATGQTWVIPGRSLNVRTPTGGFVAAATGTF
ncbi:MAG TPA: hypothetical protein VHM90_15800 [Phycisphaerae bacterium]|nr:hypothetical protein [Phycisphaerae bacterium]